MMDSYDCREVEEKWAGIWRRENSFAVDLEKAERPYYNLMMFPYPSAEGLHIGNLFAFVGSDVHGRFRRAQGYDVFEPFGFDAFGIHSENYALKTGTHPARLVPRNVANFRRQLERIGGRFNWECEVNSTDPGYYRWTQWIFVKLFEAGLVYQREAPVNWCPSCRTVLADEQAAGGECERCGSEVEPRAMRQWFARITAYAQRLLDDLDWIDWSAITRNAQQRWIGRSEGAEVVFPVDGTDEPISVFTTRPDTLWGATYLVLAPEHPLVEQIAAPEQKAALEEYARQAARKSAVERQVTGLEKTGVPTGAWAVNPANGERIPVWVADYVLMGYGTGAIMAVPAHDERDFAFAREFGLPVVEVVSPDGTRRTLTEAYTGEGVLVDSGPFTGIDSGRAIGEVAAWLEERGMGKPAVTYRLRDWCISRQRYWGPPIPVIHCDACGALPVPEEQLPVLLPEVEAFEPDGSGKSPLARCAEFVHTHCPQCGGKARRETDVSDNFLDSAWYFFRYPSADRDEVIFDPELTRKWLPVDMYIGGNEHSVLHLMYTRFLTLAFKDMGLIDFDQPFQRFRAHGLIVLNGAKMSKSKGNVVNPDEYIDRFGADTLRTYLMFCCPFQDGGDFQERGIVGVRRFYERLWRYATETEFDDGEIEERGLLALVHRTIGRVTESMEQLHYNAAVAALMELLNGFTAGGEHYRQGIRTLLQLVGPFGPFIAQELWERIGESGMIGDHPWPEWDPARAREERVEWVVQVNGRIRDRLELSAGAVQEEVEEAAFARERVVEWVGGKEVVKKIFVPDKLINIVVKG